MTRHIIVAAPFLAHTRPGLNISSTDAIAYWQKRAMILDGRHRLLSNVIVWRGNSKTKATITYRNKSKNWPLEQPGIESPSQQWKHNFARAPAGLSHAASQIPPVGPDAAYLRDRSAVGYINPKAFSITFHKTCNIPPTEYREMSGRETIS